MSSIAPPPMGHTGMMKPHRGGIILALGILGLVLCFICGIIAWVLGNGDIREMEAGRMDPAGMSLTKAGKICGIISVILASAIILIYILMFVVFAGAAVAGAAGAGGAGTGP